jgi:hypothetical protein
LEAGEDEEEEEEKAIATASEYVFVTKGGRMASITDLSIGIGVQLFESQGASRNGDRWLSTIKTNTNSIFDEENPLNSNHIQDSEG